MNNRTNIEQQIAKSSRGANSEIPQRHGPWFNTLLNTYCAPMWLNSVQVREDNVQINGAIDRG